MWAVTPELQATHILAQKALVELKGKGMEPLRAVNKAEEVSNKYYQLLKEIEVESNKIKDEEIRSKYIAEQTAKINKIFERDLGFSPGG